MVISDKTRLNLVLAGATLGSSVVGFSSAAISSTLNQPRFYSTMKMPMSPTEPGYDHTTSIISAANSIFYAGAFFGTISISWPAEKWGRVKAFQLSAFCHIVACTLQAAAQNQAMYLVSRLLAGFAVGLGTGVMTTYYSEISVPHKRGLLGGLHGLMIEVGALSNAWIALGAFYSSNSSFAWRFPIALVCGLALALLIVAFFLPETPRWLIRNGKPEDALKVLQTLHGRDMAYKEFQQIQLQTEADVEAMGSRGNLQVFLDPNYRKRLGLAIGLVCFAQSNGILLIYNYSSIIYTTLGLSNRDALALSAGWITFTAVTMACGNSVSDRFGRRALLMFGFAGCCSCLSIYTACLSRFLKTQETKWAALSVVFVFLDVIPYGAGLGTAQFTVPTEMFPNHLRSFASGVSISCIYLIQVMWLNVGPLALQRVEWKFYITFIVLGFCGIWYIFFFIPETARLPLEEIDALFGKKVATNLESVDGKPESDQVENAGPIEAGFKEKSDSPV